MGPTGAPAPAPGPPRRGSTVLLVGFGAANRALADHLRSVGCRVLVTDDDPGRLAAVPAWAEPVPPAEVPAALGAVATVYPSPGVPPHHPVVAGALARGIPVSGELDVVAAIDDRPMVAVTGTDGKTTVTVLTERVLRAAGHRAVAAGNNDLPLIAAVADPATEVFVVEASSFRLRYSHRFRPVVGAWLNLAADHLDWHGSVASYAAAKARLWAHQRPGDVAVANAGDPVVMAAATCARSRVVTFGPGADHAVESGELTVAPGVRLGAGDLARSLPHDLVNAAAVSAIAASFGVPPEVTAAEIRSFRGLPHRMELVGERDGIRFYDDSKATTPHATIGAVEGFPEVVLIAGGRNKGLDLGVLARVRDRIRRVIAIGEAAGELCRVLGAAGVPVERASDMAAAVTRAAEVASGPPPVPVLLSPACASFDAYDGYAARGDHFQREVRRLIGIPSAGEVT